MAARTIRCCAMNVTILGATGGLGRNVVDAALARGHSIRALVRDPSKARLPGEVKVFAGDATNLAQVREACEADAVFFCVNPPFSDWAKAFPPLLDTAIAAVKATKARLLFPGNVWIYGRVAPGEPLVDETRTPNPCSERGRLRLAMETTLFESGIDVRLLRLPEFYGPSVVTLTARLFRAALDGSRLRWPGPLEVPLELSFMPDAGRAMVALAELESAPPKVHLPGLRITPRALLERLAAQAGTAARVSSVPAWVLWGAGLANATVRAAFDIRHLLTHPVYLDGALAEQTLGALTPTSLEEGLARTLAWHREHPRLRLQG